jgi:hypothetical protein
MDYDGIGLVVAIAVLLTIVVIGVVIYTGYRMSSGSGGANGGATSIELSSDQVTGSTAEQYCSARNTAIATVGQIINSYQQGIAPRGTYWVYDEIVGSTYVASPGPNNTLVLSRDTGQTYPVWCTGRQSSTTLHLD